MLPPTMKAVRSNSAFAAMVMTSTSAGHFVWVEMRCRPLDKAGSTTAAGEREVVAVLRDVSERKVHEQAVEIARAEQERANASKSRFLATMSHELRTPLNAIIGFSEMLTNDELMLQPARKLEYAKLINESGLHLLSVVNGILDMSKMETGNFEITPEPFRAGSGDHELQRFAGAQGARCRRRDQDPHCARLCRKWSATAAPSIRS